MTRFACALTLLAACSPPADPGLGGSDGTDGTADTDTDASGPGMPGGGGDEQVAGCTEVCWGWNNPVPPPPATPGVVRVEDCNPVGVSPTLCPDGFTCGGLRELATLPGQSYQVAVCEGDGGPYDLIADLGAPPTPPGKRVRLTFTMLGEAWPGVGDRGEAGQLVAVGRDGIGTFVLDLPVRPDGVLETQLPEGTYDVAWTGGALLDDTRFPHWARTAVLKVVTDGDDDVDVRARRVDLQVRVDGSPVSNVHVQNAFVTLQFRGHGTGVYTRNRGVSAPLSQAIVLPLDTYDVTVSASSGGASAPLPMGSTTLASFATLDRDGPASVVVDLQTATVSGSVRINGAGHAGLPNTQVTWVPVDGTLGPRIDVTSTSPGRYSGKIWPGRYDVFLDTGGGIPQGLPFGVAKAGTHVQAGPFDIGVSTVDVSGTITRNSTQPPGGFRGYVLFSTEAGSFAKLSIDTLGDAEFAGKVFAGTGDIDLDGDGSNLPDRAWGIATHVRFGGTHDLNVRAHSVDVTLTVDGAAANGTGASRGLINFYPLDPVTGERRPREDAPHVTAYTSATIRTTSTARASALLAPGTYEVAALTNEAGNLPATSKLLGQIQVSGVVSRTYDLPTTTMTVHLTREGVDLPNPGTGTRGRLVAGSAAVDVRRTGASEATLWLVRDEVRSVYWQCHDAYDCGLDEEFVTLWTNVAP